MPGTPGPIAWCTMADAGPMSEDWALQAGTQLGHYRITKVLGRGGFGITYQAWDDQLKRLVAIKEYFLHRQVTRGADGRTVVGKVDDPAYRKRLDGFLDEARTLAQFRDARVVHVHGFSEANNTAYMVMDFVEGCSLRDHVVQHGTVSVHEAKGILIDILKGLRVIHARNYLHRDIKPANVLRRPDGSIVLLDFGSARQSVADQEQNFTVYVTPGYAPVEQYTSSEVQGPATDLYAAGACVLFCLTGSSPPEAIQRTVAEQANADDGLDPLLQLVAMRDQAGAAMAKILGWLLRPRASQRPQSAEAVLARLDAMPPSGPPLGDPSTITAEPDLAQLRAIPSRVVDEVRQRLQAAVGERAAPLLFDSIKSARNARQLLDGISSRLGDDPRWRPLVGQIQSLLVGAARKAAEGRGSESGLVGSVRAPAPPPPAIAPAQVQANAPITDEETTQHISRELAKYIGPIAHMLVKKLRTRSSSVQELISKLEAEIPNETERRVFRTEMQNITPL